LDARCLFSEVHGEVREQGRKYSSDRIKFTPQGVSRYSSLPVHSQLTYANFLIYSSRRVNSILWRNDLTLHFISCKDVQHFHKPSRLPATSSDSSVLPCLKKKMVMNTFSPRKETRGAIRLFFTS